MSTTTVLCKLSEVPLKQQIVQNETLLLPKSSIRIITLALA